MKSRRKDYDLEFLKVMNLSKKYSRTCEAKKFYKKLKYVYTQEVLDNYLGGVHKSSNYSGIISFVKENNKKIGDFSVKILCDILKRNEILASISKESEKESIKCINTLVETSKVVGIDSENYKNLQKAFSKEEYEQLFYDDEIEVSNLAFHPLYMKIITKRSNLNYLRSREDILNKEWLKINNVSNYSSSENEFRFNKDIGTFIYLRGKLI